MNPIHEKTEREVNSPAAAFDVESDDSEKERVMSSDGFPPLATTLNLWIFGLFYVFIAIGNVTAYGIGVLVYVRLYGLSLVWAFNGGLIAFTFQTIAQVVVGYYCDKVVTSYGRRKPFVIAGNALKAISMFLLVLPPSQEQSVLIGWYTAFLSTFFIGDAVYSSPFDSWLVESTCSDEDYTKIFAFSSPIGGFLGQIIGVVLLLVSPLSCGFVFLIGLGIGTYLVVKYVSNVVYRKAPALPELIPSVRICTQTVEFRKMLTNKILISAAIAIFANIAGFYLLIGFKNVNKVSAVTNLIVISAGIAAVVGVFLMVACHWLFKKWDKLQVYRAQIFIVMFLSIVCFFVTLDTDNNALVLYIAVGAAMASLAFPIRLMDSLFVRDLVLYDTFLTGLNRENMYITAFAIPSNVLQQFIAAMPVITLTFFGFVTITDASQDDDEIDEHYNWTKASLWVCRVYSSFAIFGIAFASYWVLRDYGITASVADQINEVVNRRALEKQKREEEFPAKSSDGADADSQLETAGADGSASDDTTEHERQLVLHLSVAELYHVHKAISGSSLAYISQLNIYGALTAVLTALCLLMALVTDLSRRNLYSTALIAVTLLVCFYILYEYLRYLAISELCTWDDARLKKVCHAVFSEFARQQESLKEKLKIARIVVNDYEEKDASEAHGPGRSMSDVIESVTQPRPSLLNREDTVDTAAYENLTGVKRTFFTFALLCACGVAIIVTEID